MYTKQILGTLCLGAFLTAAPLQATETGNRYNLERLYQSEISAAKAYLLTHHDRGNRHGDDFANAVIIDVRTVEEYAASHPRGAYSVPFPHVTGRPDHANDSDGYIGYDIYQDDSNDGTLPISDFTDYVLSRFPDRDTPILTLCRTGYRSVQAANELAKVGYTHVRNIWQGFFGRPKTDIAKNVLDLNNNGIIGDTGDLDGWIGYQELPYSTRLRPQLLDTRYADLY